MLGRLEKVEGSAHKLGWALHKLLPGAHSILEQHEPCRWQGAPLQRLHSCSQRETQRACMQRLLSSSQRETQRACMQRLLSSSQGETQHACMQRLLTMSTIILRRDWKCCGLYSAQPCSVCVCVCVYVCV